MLFGTCGRTSTHTCMRSNFLLFFIITIINIIIIIIIITCKYSRSRPLRHAEISHVVPCCLGHADVQVRIYACPIFFYDYVLLKLLILILSNVNILVRVV